VGNATSFVAASVYKDSERVLSANWLGYSMNAPSDGKCHILGKRAHRVSQKYELVSITAALFDLDLLKFDYSVGGLPVTGMGLRQVGADMDMNRIETWIDPDLPSQGWTDTCGEPAGRSG